jgi:hypothetical protein
VAGADPHMICVHKSFSVAGSEVRRARALHKKWVFVAGLWCHCYYFFAGELC